MLELMLLRHAKSDWDAAFDLDRDRPLNDRGVQSARAVGAFLSKIDRVPDLALSSPAVRARTTVEIAAEAGSWPSPIRLIPQLYSGGPGDLLDAVRSAPNVGRLLIVGHEPTISTTVSRLIGGGSVRVPTAALIEFRLAFLNWSNVEWGSGDLTSIMRARSLVKAGYG